MRREPAWVSSGSATVAMCAIATPRTNRDGFGMEGGQESGVRAHSAPPPSQSPARPPAIGEWLPTVATWLIRPPHRVRWVAENQVRNPGIHGCRPPVVPLLDERLV